MQIEGIDVNRYILHFEGGTDNFFYDNKSAHSVANILTQAINKPKDINPIFIYGPSGCGKTHLLRGFTEDFHARHPDKSVQMLSTHEFIDEWMFALKTEIEWFFEEKYSNIDLLILDNLSNIIGRPFTENKLKDFLERALSRGTFVICVSNIPLEHYFELHPMFKDKFSDGIVAEMTHAGRDSRKDYIQHYSETLGIFVPVAEREVLSSGQSTIYSIKGAINKYSLNDGVSL